MSLHGLVPTLPGSTPELTTVQTGRRPFWSGTPPAACPPGRAQEHSPGPELFRHVLSLVGVVSSAHAARRTKVRIPRTASKLPRAALVPLKADPRQGVRVEECKENLLQVLRSKRGDAKDPEVVNAVEALSRASALEGAPKAGTWLDGDWVQVNKPSYPGEIGNQVYTLGRMTFNIFAPKDMRWRIRRVLQPVRPIRGTEDGSRTTDTIMHLECVDERYPAFKAVLCTRGELKPSEEKPGRLHVRFSGGEFKPTHDMDSALLPQWKEAFTTALGGERPWLSRVGDWLLRMAMGLEKPKAVAQDGTMAYAMARAPHGYLDVLYLDENLRVTKGNRGSIVVVEK